MELLEQLSKAIGPLSAAFAGVIVVLFRKMAKDQKAAGDKSDAMWADRVGDFQARIEEQDAKVTLLLTTLQRHTEARIENDAKEK